ncbi:LemA family protein [Salinicoccus roseus]|uniref:LemA family protein n=1 Tax=Salinicoccus roseus TaxID=45670 RepID=A0A265E8C5_9STAP|nr:LemA family protein [Salinicoccus roseus]MBY8909996.1 LemA family protein [Salinicoccus roseus]OZT77849.1 LemA family protein [Salinicoccus roseus]RPE53902.1 LemA protein [Salinicoccus roseus]GGA70026.1 LemA family protein [Salinicoccus roseus]
MRKLLIPLGIIVGFFIILAIIFAPKYNQFVNLEEEVNQKEAQIETQLQRRGDLIPNLVNTVQGYASHEEEIFTDIADARSRLSGAGNVEEMAEANNEMTSALSRLLAISENYPDLQASEQFTGLRDELAGAENRIAVARQDYNTAVQEFNRNTRTFPGNMVAGMFGFSEKPYFEADETSRDVPEVEFNTDQDEE